ncbi:MULTISPECIES: hypothetical protein [unclassified Nocardia]|uniref:hypothetical protein n=1 Tax=unclassified Nocardia TaxID=2637762 RepID=UPI0024A8C52D|nr:MULTISPECIES: hypothetical protein [unclassified Nocardia]
MTRSIRIRQAHRWLAVTFVATTVVTVIGLAVGGPEWLSYLPLPPLAVLAFSGLYLLVSSYTSARRGAAPRPVGWVRGQRVRQAHRWSAVVFTVTVLATFVALAPEEPIVWVSYLPLIPLAALLVTGSTMLVRWWRARSVPLQNANRQT